MSRNMKSVLEKHLATVEAFYRQDKKKIDLMIKTMIDSDAGYNPALVKERGYAEGVKIKAKGNSCYKRGEFEKARLLYTECLAAAIDGPIAATAYGNRSAALFEMKLFKECLKDIDRALSLDYPNQLKAKLYIRKVRCLKYLGQDHTNSLREAFNVIEKFNPESISKQLIKAAKEDFEKASEPSTFSTKLPEAHIWTLPTLSYGANSEVPSFSKAVNLEYNEDLGRHLVANRDIKIGDVLVVDKCFVASTAKEVRWDFCSKCFKSCLTLIPCIKCGYVMYCDQECRDSDWSSGHDYACFFIRCCYEYGSMNNAFDSLNLGRTTIEPGRLNFNCDLQRMVGFLGIENIKNAVLQDNDPVECLSDGRTKGFINGKLEIINLESILSLKDNFEKLTMEEKKCFSGMALLLAGLHRIPEDERIPVASLLLKIILIVRLNQKSIYYFKTDYSKLGLPRVVVGTGMYLSSTLVRHSCDANMIQVGYGSTLVYRARRPISKGEELTDCFLASASNLDRKQRRAIFKSFDFKCKCQACEQNWPILPDLPSLNMSDAEVPLMINEAGFNLLDETERNTLVYYLQFGIPADSKILPKMIDLLRGFHNSKKHRMTQWYFMLQECIKNHFRAMGNNFYYGDSKDIFDGKKNFSYSPCDLKTRLNNIQGIPSSF